MMEVVVTTGAISRAKLQSNHHHQQTNTQFFLQAGCPSCRPTNSVKPLKEKKVITGSLHVKTKIFSELKVALLRIEGLGSALAPPAGPGVAWLPNGIW